MVKTKKEQTKRLTLTELAKQEKELNAQKDILLLGKYKEQISVHFTRSKLDQLVAHYLRILTALRERDDVTVETLYRSAVLLNTLICKYFTTIDLPSLEDIDSLVQVSTVLVDMGIFEALFDGENGFTKEELDKLSAQVNKSAKQIGEKYAELALQSTFNETKTEGDSVDATVQ